MKRGSRFDELLTLLFMALFIGAVVCFFVLKNNPTYYILGGVAIVLRIAQYIMRLF
jgi:hypothetical protein